MSGVSPEDRLCQAAGSDAGGVVVPAWVRRVFASSTPAVWSRGMVLFALVVVVLLPGLFTMPPVDRDESRFAQASRQMAVGDGQGGFVVPYVGDRVRLNKPPLVYWLQAGVVRVFGDGASREGLYAEEARAWRTGGIGWYRVPSVVCAALAAVGTWWIGRMMWVRQRGGSDALVGEVGAFVAGVLLGVCVMVLWDGRQARADQLLLACTMLAMGGLWRCWVEGSVGSGRVGRVSWSSALLLWGGLALGVMAKGPITPMVAGLCALSMCMTTGRWAWLGRVRWVSGVGLVLIVVGAWVFAVAERVGFREYAAIVWQEVVVRSGEAAEGHWGPPGYHLVLLPAVFWPGSLLTAAAVAWLFAKRPRRGVSNGGFGRVGQAWRSGTARLRGRGGWAVFVVGWVVPAWVVFELVSTKLPHYTLPLYPALALVTGRFVAECACGRVRVPRDLGARVGVMVWGLIGVGLVGAVPMVLAVAADGDVTGAAIGGAVGAAIVLVGVVAAWRGRALGATVAGVAASFVASATVWGVVAPSLSGTWVSSGIAQVIAAADPASERPVAASRYDEDSLIFLSAGRAERVGVRRVPAWAAEHPDGLVVMRVPMEWGDDGEADRAGVVGEVVGFNYNGGGWERVRVMDAWAGAAAADRLVFERTGERLHDTLQDAEAAEAGPRGDGG